MHRTQKAPAAFTPIINDFEIPVSEKLKGTSCLFKKDKNAFAGVFV